MLYMRHLSLYSRSIASGSLSTLQPVLSVKMVTVSFGRCLTAMKVFMPPCWPTVKHCYIQNCITIPAVSNHAPYRVDDILLLSRF